MKIGLCGLEVTEDKVFLAFAQLKKGRLLPIAETVISYEGGENNLLKKDTIEKIYREIEKKEKKYSLLVEKIYLQLPQEWEEKKIFSDEILLTKNKFDKKITLRDINLAKRMIENLALENDEKLLHHFVLEYEVKGCKYLSPPMGISAKKLKIKSLLISLKTELFGRIKNLFESIMDRELTGFVYYPLCYLALLREEVGKDELVLVNIKNKETDCFVFSECKLSMEKTIDFGEEKIVNNISKKFCLPTSVITKTIYQFASLKETSLSKQVHIKHKNRHLYLNLSDLNLSLQQLCKEKIGAIMEIIQDKLKGKRFQVFFLGKLTKIEGFNKFIQKTFSSLPVNELKMKHSLAFGCLKYGVFKFSEKEEIKNKESILKKLVNIYQEYF